MLAKLKATILDERLNIQPDSDGRHPHQLEQLAQLYCSSAGCDNK
jgi:hypothetical protein